MIIQFSRSPQLQDILKNIEKYPFKFSNEEIISQVDQFLPSYNCEGAALGYFSIISHLCYFRSDLEKPLMKIAVKPLYYLGIIDPESEILWVQSYVKKKSIIRKNNLYYTSSEGEIWIQNQLKFKQDLIKEIIQEIITEDSIEE
ncbi:hypothetical protein [Gorillibacterium sp. sgz5001074]|uniref:hypothetical protein n=1 Tax=Gorillibacterium sp. sgz5001074 TaxID=3446695 RepID=UPI003F664144